MRPAADMRSARGDLSASALDTFCRAEYPKVLGMLTLLCNDRELATELTQETMIRVVQHWKDVSAMEAPGTWVNPVAVDLAHSWFRRTMARRRAIGKLVQRSDDVVSRSDSAEQIALRQAVAELPARQRSVVVLRFYADLAPDDVARAMGIKPGTVWALTSQAIASLRRSGIADLPEVTA